MKELEDRIKALEKVAAQDWQLPGLRAQLLAFGGDLEKLGFRLSDLESSVQRLDSWLEAQIEAALAKAERSEAQ